MLTDVLSFPNNCFRQTVDGVLPSLGYANYMLQDIGHFSEMEMPSLNSFVMCRVVLSANIQHIYRHFPFNVSSKVTSDF